MRSSEWIAFVYFLYIAACAWLRARPWPRRAGLTVGCVAAASATWWIARAGWPGVRDWAPGVNILIGYYASGYLFTSPSLRMESWLMSWDRRLLGDPTTRFRAWPRALLGFLEIVYMGCFLVIGAGFLILVVAGHASLADRYWTTVVGAELGSFGPLAFVQTRPPWALERKAVLADPAIHEVAVAWTERLTIGANTFPSGHVAGSLAAALAVATAMPAAGAALLFVCGCIAVGCVVGRYHYVVDVVAGAALAAAIGAIVVALGI